MKVIVCNAFALSMLDREAQRNDAKDAILQPRTPRPCDDPKAFLSECEPHAEILSAVGHADTAALFGDVLGREVAANRVSVKIDAETLLLIGQYIGPRLPEGATTLPEGATIEWWTV